MTISIDGKRKLCTVHRLVASAFIDNPDDLRDVNHKDGVKTNNSVENLEWVKHSDNIKHAYRVLMRKRNSRPVRCVETGVIYQSIKEASLETGINKGSINHAIHGISKTAGGYQWVAA